MDATWIIGLVAATIACVLSWWFSPWEKEERSLEQLQKDADVLETHIRNFLMAWWKTSGNDDPAFRWRLKVSMVSGKVCAYAWRHCRHREGEPNKVVVHSKYWSHFEGGRMDRNSRIMDEALSFVEVAFKKGPTPLSGFVSDHDDS